MKFQAKIMVTKRKDGRGQVTFRKIKLAKFAGKKVKVLVETI